MLARSWSRDGVSWSDPRIGGYNSTISFLNGTSMNCRRERPQILLDPESGEPIGISNGVQVVPPPTLITLDLTALGLHVERSWGLAATSWLISTVTHSLFLWCVRAVPA